MSAIYVVDAHALIELQSMNLPDSTLHQVLDEMTELVKVQRLCFPTPVIKFCRSFASGEAVTTWVNAVSGHRKLRAVNTSFQTDVLDVCEDVADEDDPEESAPLFVAAMCMELLVTTQAIIVTEDRLPQPTRMCFVDACRILGLQTMTLREFLTTEIITPLS